MNNKASFLKSFKNLISSYTVVYFHALIVIILIVFFEDLRLSTIILINTSIFSLWMFLLYYQYFTALQLLLFIINITVLLMNNIELERWFVPGIIIADMTIQIYLITNNIKTIFIPNALPKDSGYHSLKLHIGIIDDSLKNNEMTQIFKQKEYIAEKITQLDIDHIIDQCASFDLIIINSDTHNQHGLKLLESIRQVFPNGTLDIIMIVSNDEERNIAFYLGADDVISSSSNKKELFSRIERFKRLSHIRLNASESAMLVRQSQIKPHFLFNALSVISSNISTNPEIAKENIQDLSVFLRKSFDNIPKEGMITLKEELELIKAYLSIEKSRYSDRLNIEYNIDENITIDIPILTLQPLVENAIQHGISKKRYGGSVHLNIINEQTAYLFEVIDNGIGMKADKVKQLCEFNSKEHFGLSNINARLKAFYGTTLQIESSENEGTRVYFRINKGEIK